MMNMSETMGMSSDSPMMSMMGGGSSTRLWTELLSGDNGN